MAVLGTQVTLDEAFKAANDVLHGAVAGIAEIISCPGMINVDFADVRTVMAEMGMAMMGSAKAAGPDRARVAAEQAVACPLLEDINISDARGVLVNISASRASFQLQEMYDVMETIKAFAADSATVIVGTVYDEGLEDQLRVTIVATGLGKPAVRQASKPQPLTVIAQKTGTDNHARRRRLRRARPAGRHPAPQPRRDGRGDAAIRRGDARHSGFSAQAGRLTMKGLPCCERREHEGTVTFPVPSHRSRTGRALAFCDRAWVCRSHAPDAICANEGRRRTATHELHVKRNRE